MDSPVKPSASQLVTKFSKRLRKTTPEIFLVDSKNTTINKEFHDSSKQMGIGKTSEISGPVAQVEGKVNYKIKEKILTLEGFAFYGGNTPSSGNATTNLNMFINKAEIGLNSKHCLSDCKDKGEKIDGNEIALPIYCLNEGVSTGTFTSTGAAGRTFIVTLFDYDLYKILLTFEFPSDLLDTVHTFTYSIQHGLHKCNHECSDREDKPIINAYETGIQQFGSAFLRDQNLFNQYYSIAVGPSSTLIMTNSTIKLKQKKCPYETFAKIFTQNPNKTSFWPPAMNVDAARPFYNSILYDKFAKKFVISQIRWLAPIGSNVYAGSEIFFAISKTSNPRNFSEKYWCKFVFDRRLPILGNFDMTFIIQLASDLNAYYLTYFVSRSINNIDEDFIQVVGIKKDEIHCERPLIPRDILRIDDGDLLTLVRMLDKTNYIYAILTTDNQPFVLYRISLNKVQSKIIPITANDLEFGSAVSKDLTIWVTYYTGTNTLVWYEFDVKKFRLVQSQEIIYTSGLRSPTIMVDKHFNMFLGFQILAPRTIVSIGYTYRKRDDPINTTRSIRVIKNGTENSETAPFPTSSIDPCNDSEIYTQAQYSFRTGNWKSLVFTFQL